MKPTCNILLLDDRLAGARSLAFNPRRATVLSLLALSTLCGSLLYSGFHLGISTEARRQLAEVVALQDLYDQQRENIASARKAARTGLDTLALRLGQMQAQLVRLDALGVQLARQTGFDAAEFDFDNPPSMGGPQEASALPSTSVTDFLGMLEELDATAKDRQDKLAALKQLLMHRDLRARVTPSGRAADHGLVSSAFGRRIDPFTGTWEEHKGIDIAGKEGSEVMALGDGVVIWSGERPGYGDLVEIDHGRGYITRYGHNKKRLVQAGDTVRKGQTIALMGSTGRSTGPHVHIEVVHNGKQVDPAGYLKD